MSSLTEQMPRTYHEILSQLEGANTQITALVSTHFDPCFVLDASSSINNSDQYDLSYRINNYLVDLQRLVNSQLEKIRCAHAKAANSLVVRLCSMPRELLVEIFTHVLKDTDIRSIKRDMMKEQMILFYRRSVVLQTVCSRWREIILSTGIFWTLVPLILPPDQNYPLPKYQMIRDRSIHHSDLHLAIFEIKASHRMESFPEVSDFFSRLSTLNIQATKKTAEAILTTLNCAPILPLSELSINEFECVPTNSITKRYEPLDKLVFKLKDSLTILRVRRVDITFSNDLRLSHLTHLRIQDVTLEDQGAHRLLSAIGSSPFLRTLQLISIQATGSLSPQDNFKAAFSPNHLVVLTNLEELYLEDLFLDFANVIAHSIKSDSHRLVLSVTQRIFHIRDHRTPGTVDSHTVFRDIEVGALIIRMGGLGFEPKPWLDLLYSMGRLNELYLHEWGPHFSQLIHHPENSGPRMPALKRLHLTQAFFWSRDRVLRVLKALIKSHSLQHLTFGGQALERSSNSKLEWHPIDPADSTMIAHLERMVPSFLLLASAETPPQFFTRDWRLWW